MWYLWTESLICSTGTLSSSSYAQNAVGKENKAVPEEDIEGQSSFPPAKLKTPADGQQRLNCLIATEGTPKDCTSQRDLGKAGRYLGLVFIAIYFPISLHVEDSEKLTRLRFWWLAARGCDTSHSQVCAWCCPSSVCTGKGPGVTPLARHTSNRFLRSNVFE